MEDQLQQIRQLATKAVPQSQWLTTQEFAEKTGLKPKTVSNYAGKGRFKHLRKAENGHYLIHITELEKWSK